MKHLKKLLAAALTAALLCGVALTTASAADPEAALTDVPSGAWYETAVNWCRTNGIMSGTSATEFSPNTTMSRAMLATILYNAADRPNVSTGADFMDVAAGSWYADAAAWASANGIITGYGNGLFGSNDPVTREQFAAILWRYDGSSSIESGADFADEADISAYAAQAVDWVQANGIMNGVEGNRFDPKGNATRAQAAVILFNYLGSDTSGEPAAPSGPAAEETQTNAFNLETRTVLLNNGIEMPILGIGTFTLTNEQASDSVFWALSDGYHLIDTAAAYNNEEGVGDGIRRALEAGVVEREDIFLTTKLWPSAYNMEGIDASLERLGVDYIDLLLLHQPIGDYIAGYQAMEQAVAQGKVRAIGLSNFRPNLFDEIMEIATITPAVNQVETHPYYHEVEMMEYLKQYGTVLEAWYPLGGRGNTQTMFADETISAIAAAHGKSSAQIILRWHLQAGHIAIPGSNNPDHILENISIFDFELTDEEMAAMTAIDRNDPFFGGFGGQDELEDAANRWGLDNN